MASKVSAYAARGKCTCINSISTEEAYPGAYISSCSNKSKSSASIRTDKDSSPETGLTSRFLWGVRGRRWVA